MRPTSRRCAHTPGATPGASTSPDTRAGAAADPEHARGVRRAGAGARHPGAHAGHRRGPGAHAVPACAGARRRGVGRQAHLVPHQRRIAGKPRHLHVARADGQRVRGAAQRALEHDRRPGDLGPAAHVRGAGARLRSCSSPTASRPRRSTGRCATRPAPWPRRSVSPTYFGAVADVARARRRGPLARRAADRGRGLGRAPRVPPGPARARPLARRRPRDLEHAQDRGQHDPVGDAAPRAQRPARRARDRPLADAARVDQPELAAHRLARRRAQAGGGARRGAARRDARRHSRPRAPPSARSPGSTCSTSGMAGQPGRVRLRPAAAGHRRARHRQDGLRDRAADAASSTTSTSSCSPRTWWWRCSGSARTRPRSGAKLVAALHHVVDELPERGRPRGRDVRAAAPVGPARDGAARGLPRHAGGRALPRGGRAASPRSRSPPTRPASPTCCRGSDSRVLRSTTSSARSPRAAACAAPATASWRRSAWWWRSRMSAAPDAHQAAMEGAAEPPFHEELE